MREKQQTNQLLVQQTCETIRAELMQALLLNTQA